MARKMTAAKVAEMEAQEALSIAQELFYTACEARTAKQRIAIAEKAVAISPFCADAYAMLAEHAPYGSDAALDLWHRAVEGGKQALGEAFEDYHGEFWGFLETRPYMRARFGLACALWDRGARDDAQNHLREMLELNPNDNQGVRYVLAAWLVEAGSDDRLNALLQRYPNDGSAAWNWTKALAAFRRGGDTAEARRLLLDAFKANAHVAAFLCGQRDLPKTQPPFITRGGEDEASDYALEAGEGWLLTPGAMDWLRGCLVDGKSNRLNARVKADAMAEPEPGAEVQPGADGKEKAPARPKAARAPAKAKPRAPAKAKAEKPD